jgi:cholesterol oxidase
MPPMHTISRPALAKDWHQRRPDGYDVVVIGSGYGGAITAARLATAQWPGTKPSICVLERGKEWLPGQFPDRLSDAAHEVRSPVNPLGLYDFQFGADIGVFVGSGLGGTSLINANVAIQPDNEVFDDPQWPQAIRDARDASQLQQYFSRVKATLAAGQHPHVDELSKAKLLQQGANGVAGAEFAPVDIAVNFQFEQANNHWGVPQRRCINCGDCVTGCNVGAKNTLDVNYLAIAKHGGADLFTQVEVRRVEKNPGGGFLVHYRRRESASSLPEEGTIEGKRVVVLAAGALGSTEILLRSRQQGLSLADTLGTRLSGNGDFFGVAYNGDHRADVLGWGAYPASDRAQRLQPQSGPTLLPGPTIVSRVKYNTNGPVGERITVEDTSIPLLYVDTARSVFAWVIGHDTDAGDFFEEHSRRVRDIGAFDPRLESGALNHTLLYLVMGKDNASGQVDLHPITNAVRIRWPGVGNQTVFEKANQLILNHAAALGATFVENPLWRFTLFQTLLTVHPLGGCPMGEDHTTGLVNDVGQVFDAGGNLHEGLHVSDGSIIPTALNVNPFLTISALTERIAEMLVTGLGGTPTVISSI